MKACILAQKGCSSAFSYGMMLHDRLNKFGHATNIDISQDDEVIRLEKARISGFRYIIHVNRIDAMNRTAKLEFVNTGKQQSCTIGELEAIIDENLE